jgi:microcystin-dependent protein
MATPYLGQITTFSFNFAPRGWALCNGQLLSITQNQALFSLLGTTYGGDGRTTFGLPNLQGKCALSFGAGFVQGQTSGEINHQLTLAELPLHTHTPVASSAAATATSPIGEFPAVTNNNPYTATAASPVSMVSSSAGSSQPHPNQSPYLVINFCIALTGIFPSRN